MPDEKLSTAQRPPEMEEAAPAPASAIGTANTSNEVTNDITTPHGDAQSITKTNTAESPSQLGVPAPETSGSDDAWRYVCALINEFTSEKDYRSGDFGREHVREPDPYAINQAPVAYSRKKDCARREGAAFADRLEYVFDELDDEMRAVVRDGWAGREAARDLKSGEDSCAERASKFAGRLFRELTGREAGNDDCARGFIECGDTLLNCFDAGCFSLGVARVCGVDLGRADPDEDDRLGRALMRSGYGAEDHRAYIPGDANPHSAAEIDADIEVDNAMFAVDELIRDDEHGSISAKRAAAKKLAEDELKACRERLRQVRRDALVAAGERVYGRDADHVTSRPPEDGELPFAVLGQKLRLNAARQRDAIEAFQMQAEALLRTLADEVGIEVQGEDANLIRGAALKGMLVAASGECFDKLPYDRPVEMKRLLQLVESGLPESSPLRETIKRHGAVLIGGDEALKRVKSRIKADPWSVAPDLDPFLRGDDGVVCWMTDAGGYLSLLLPDDTERAIFRRLEETVRMKGVPLKADGEPDLGALARFYIEANRRYVLQWNHVMARKDGKNDPLAKEKDPALSINWPAKLMPDQIARVIALAFGTDGGAGSLICKDGVLTQFGDHGLEPVEDATGTKHVEGRVRGWVVEACPSADERAMDAAVVRLKHLVPQLSTRKALARHEIDVNSFVINEGANVITSVGPNAFRMRVTTPQDFVRCGAVPGAHYVATSEPDDDGWMDCELAVPHPRYSLPNKSGELVIWDIEEQAATLNPEHPELMLDAQLQRTRYVISGSAGLETNQSFVTNVGAGGAGKTFDCEWTTTLVVGVDRPEDRTRLVGSVSPTKYGDDNQVLTLVGRRLNWRRDMGTNPRIKEDDYDRLKALTGGEPDTLNRKWDSSITTDAVAVPLVANSNNEIQFPSYDLDMTRRQKRVPYTHAIPEDKKIRGLMTKAKTEADIASWYFDQAIHRYPTFEDFAPNELMDDALKEAVAEADTLSQQVKGALSLLRGSWVPVEFAYQFITRWVSQNMSNTRIASIQRVKKELPRVLKPLGLVYVSDQFRWRGRFSPEVNAAAVHSLCEPQIRYDQNGHEVARDYRPAALANWADAVETAVGGRDRLRGWIIREDAWEQWQESGTMPDPNSGVALVDEEAGGSADADDARERAVYERIYVPLVAGLAALGAKDLGLGPVRALGFDAWRAAGCPSAVALREQLTEAEIRAVGEHPELALSAPFGASAGAGVRVVYLVERSPELALTAPATVPCLDVAYLVVSGRAEIAAGNAPAVVPDPNGDDPDDDPTPGPGGAAPTSSDAPEDVKTPDETAAQGTCDVSAPADGAHEAPAPSDRAPAANGPSAPAETPVSAAPAAVEGGDAAEEAPGAPDPGYEAFCRHAKGAVELIE